MWNPSLLCFFSTSFLYLFSSLFPFLYIFFSYVSFHFLSSSFILFFDSSLIPLSFTSIFHSSSHSLSFLLPSSSFLPLLFTFYQIRFDKYKIFRFLFLLHSSSLPLFFSFLFHFNSSFLFPFIFFHLASSSSFLRFLSFSYLLHSFPLSFLFNSSFLHLNFSFLFPSFFLVFASSFFFYSLNLHSSSFPFLFLFSSPLKIFITFFHRLLVHLFLSSSYFLSTYQMNVDD